jgi:PleD family two-component response regulator
LQTDYRTPQREHLGESTLEMVRIYFHITIIIQLKKIAMKKILIVDDEPNIVMSLEYTFKKNNFEVFIARTDKKH